MMVKAGLMKRGHGKLILTMQVTKMKIKFLLIGFNLA